jgi:hypothetical protein
MGRAKSFNDNDYKDYKEISLNRGRKGMNCGKTCGKVGGKATIKSDVAEAKADYLIDKFHAPQCRLFFLKCIYHLPEYKLEMAVEAAFSPSVKSHIRYFTVCAKKALEAEGY